MSFAVDADFTGGNILVEGIEGDHVRVERDVRDTGRDWFYWAFRVTGAAGRTLTFTFPSVLRIGFYGPAVSHDLENWTWLDQKDDAYSFTYTFAENENEVYFAHHMLYHPERFMRFAADRGLAVKTLCRTRGGNELPMVEFGEGERTIVLTARHHCCESTGNYVLEGALESLVGSVPDGYRVFCVPFVDYDGVMAGDQGKDRVPHDHARDYIDDPIYPEIAAMMSYMKKHHAVFAFDFHSPYHWGEGNDFVYLIKKFENKLDRLNRFGDLFMASLEEGSMPYRREWDYEPGTRWNAPEMPNLVCFVNKLPEADIAMTLETTYFGRPGTVKFSTDGAVALGRAFGNAIKKYIGS